MNPLQDFLDARVPKHSKNSKPNYGPLAIKIGLTLSGFLRGIKEGTLSIETCLRVAKALGENPVLVLRAAGKANEAELLERIYDAPRRFLSEDDWRHMEQWRATPADKRAAITTLLDTSLAYTLTPPETANRPREKKSKSSFRVSASDRKDHPRQ